MGYNLASWTRFPGLLAFLYTVLCHFIEKNKFLAPFIADQVIRFEKSTKIWPFPVKFDDN